jgi:hypothetical protein
MKMFKTIVGKFFLVIFYVIFTILVFLCEVLLIIFKVLKNASDPK